MKQYARKIALKAEPLVFKAISPLLEGRKARHTRSFSAQKYCKGYGAKIGALMQPILVPAGSKTRYIDAMPSSYWRGLPGNENVDIVDPDIIDDGATLISVADGTFDYLIAAHVLEHVDDAIAALKTWVRVVKPGGHILIAVPDKRFCGEQDRPTTSVPHFICDHEEGPQFSAEEHYCDFGTHLKGYSARSADRCSCGP